MDEERLVDGHIGFQHHSGRVHQVYPTDPKSRHVVDVDVDAKRVRGGSTPHQKHMGESGMVVDGFDDDH